MEDRLQKFARVVEKGSITAAAKDLHISQPALSTALHKLERELKIELIKHTGRTIEITAAGHLVYGVASDIRTKLQDLSKDLSQLRQQKATIRIGMIDSLAELLCSKGDLLHELETTANTSLVVNNSGFLAQSVTQGALDVALVAWQPRATTLEITDLGSEPLVLVVRSDGLAGVQALVRQGTIPNFLAYNPASNTFRLIDNYFAQRGQRPQSIFHSTSPEIILQLVLAGRGAAVLPYQMVQEQLEAGLLAQITGDSIERPIAAIRAKGRTASSAVQHCIDKTRFALAQLTDAAKKHR